MDGNEQSYLKSLLHELEELSFHRFDLKKIVYENSLPMHRWMQKVILELSCQNGLKDELSIKIGLSILYELLKLHFVGYDLHTLLDGVFLGSAHLKNYLKTSAIDLQGKIGKEHITHLLLSTSPHLAKNLLEALQTSPPHLIFPFFQESKNSITISIPIDSLPVFSYKKTALPFKVSKEALLLTLDSSTTSPFKVAPYLALAQKKQMPLWIVGPIPDKELSAFFAFNQTEYNCPKVYLSTNQKLPFFVQECSYLALDRDRLILPSESAKEYGCFMETASQKEADLLQKALADLEKALSHGILPGHFTSLFFGLEQIEKERLSLDETTSMGALCFCKGMRLPWEEQIKTFGLSEKVLSHELLRKGKGFGFNPASCKIEPLLPNGIFDLKEDLDNLRKGAIDCFEKFLNVGAFL